MPRTRQALAAPRTLLLAVVAAVAGALVFTALRSAAAGGGAATCTLPSLLHNQKLVEQVYALARSSDSAALFASALIRSAAAGTGTGGGAAGAGSTDETKPKPGGGGTGAAATDTAAVAVVPKAGPGGKYSVPALSKALAHKHSRDSIIIVTWANFHFFDFVLNWVHHMREHRITNYLVGAMDAETGQVRLGAGGQGGRVAAAGGDGSHDRLHACKPVRVFVDGAAFQAGCLVQGKLLCCHIPPLSHHCLFLPPLTHFPPTPPPPCRHWRPWASTCLRCTTRRLGRPTRGWGAPTSAGARPPSTKWGGKRCGAVGCGPIGFWPQRLVSCFLLSWPLPPPLPPHHITCTHTWGMGCNAATPPPQVYLARTFTDYGLDLCLCDVDTVWINGAVRCGRVGGAGGWAVQGGGAVVVAGVSERMPWVAVRAAPNCCPTRCRPPPPPPPHRQPPLLGHPTPPNPANRTLPFDTSNPTPPRP